MIFDPQSVLIVSEKPSVARNIVKALAISYSLTFKAKKGKSRFNPINIGQLNNEIIIKVQKNELDNYAFTLHAGITVSITSVSGHLMSFDYLPPFDKKTDWQASDPFDLIKAEPVEIPISELLVEQIEELGQNIDCLVIATDWDNQGESIGGQIVRTINKVNPHVSLITRMRFTSTAVSTIKNAFEIQHELDQQLIESVDSLRKQDLRMGAALTRFLTVGIQTLTNHKRLISYGPCQSSVLWIVAKKNLERENFVPQAYWRMLAECSTQNNSFLTDDNTKNTKRVRKKTNKNKDKDTDKKTKKTKKADNEAFIFEWTKSPINDLKQAQTSLEVFSKITSATVKDYSINYEMIERPKPLDTDTLEADGARLFKVSPKLIADTAEKLYNLGFITYPRTESSYYPYNDLTPLCEKFLEDSFFGTIAKECVTFGNVKNPSKGRYSKDHEPITPVRPTTEKEIAEAINESAFENNLAWRIYEFITRRFFATIHCDGKVRKTQIQLLIGEEIFTYEGQIIEEKGFLEHYPYRKISIKPSPVVKIGDYLNIKIYSQQEYTVPPDLWTESQLIREMARLNIGTDATRSQHIATIQNRGFSKVQKPKRALLPTEIGKVFFQVFTDNAEELIIPKVRETVENWTKRIYTKELTPSQVDTFVINLTEKNLRNLQQQQDKIFPILLNAIEKSTKSGTSFGPCECGEELILTYSLKNKRFLKCSDETHNKVYPLPKNGELFPLDEQCRSCNALNPIQVGTGTKAWIFCPKCWIERQDAEGLLFCSRCQFENCSYSAINHDYTTKTERGKMGLCPNCLNGEVGLYFDEWKTIVECQNCKMIWNAPNIRQGTSIEIGGPCKLCNLSTLVIKRKNRSPYNMCPFCSLLCFQCIHRCYG